MKYLLAEYEAILARTLPIHKEFKDEPLSIKNT